jgi:hypothetical protein
METIDWATVLTDAGTLAIISSILVVVIQFIKVLWYKLPWKFAKNTPGEVWFALSIILGIAIAVALNYQILLDTGTPLMERFGTVMYGLTIGAGSKVIHAVSSTAGAKLKEVKDNVGGTAPITPPSEIPVENATTSSVVVSPCEEIAPNVQTPQPQEVVLVKSMKDDEVYVMIDGIKYKISKRLIELDTEKISS